MIRLSNEGMFGKVPSPPEPPEDQDQELQVGDWIRCHDKDDMVETFMALVKEGIDSDFRYERFGQKGIWLEITAVEGED